MKGIETNEQIVLNEEFYFCDQISATVAYEEASEY